MIITEPELEKIRDLMKLGGIIPSTHPLFHRTRIHEPHMARARNMLCTYIADLIEKATP